MTRGNPTISSERERMSEETKDEMNWICFYQ
jgi:hypothetical protein